MATPGMEKTHPVAPQLQNLRTYAERYSAGKALREACPRKSHAGWKAPANRRDPVELVLASEKGRIPDLLPLRHGRMVRSAFTFYRGAALTMAADLAHTPSTGIYVQCCGDAHLCNFGGFATPERKIILSINDLDETLPAPWEWDLKRLVASFVVACRDNGLSDAVAEDVVDSCVRTYRESMAEFSQMKTLDLWYYALEPEELQRMCSFDLKKRMTQRIEEEKRKSAAEEIFPKLAEKKGEKPIIKDQLPTIFHAPGHIPGEVQRAVIAAFAKYREILSASTQSLLDRYEVRDAAIKVVGIGSVGTACWVLLHQCVGEERNVGMGQGRIHTDHLRVGLGPDQAGEAITRIAADAFAGAPVLFVEHHSHWHVEWLEPGQLKVLGQRLNARLMTDRRPGIRGVRRRLGGIFSAIAVHLIESCPACGANASRAV